MLKRPHFSVSGFSVSGLVLLEVLRVIGWKCTKEVCNSSLFLFIQYPDQSPIEPMQDHLLGTKQFRTLYSICRYLWTFRVSIFCVLNITNFTNIEFCGAEKIEGDINDKASRVVDELESQAAVGDYQLLNPKLVTWTSLLPDKI